MDKFSGITRCDGAGCPRKGDCYRHRTPPSTPAFRFVAAPVDLDGACPHFWPVSLGTGLVGERLEIEDACREVCAQFMADLGSRVLRVDKYRSLLLDCPNYVWDAAVEVAGGGSHTLAVEWLLAPCRELGMIPPIEVVVRDNPDRVFELLGDIACRS